ncbi:MAG: pilus assembly protein TadG [Devosia nanyangense]|uniref:Pilus assembly protein TadG n=1 Tax=Devosia nanyangense TaxID=1228055 RepID=A0A933L042_9HYPH|nr:pilus assembly protein TadG [Devosia nanyangense]
MSRLFDLFRRFRRDERGAFMVIFAVLALVLIATSGAVVDFTQVQQARTRAQTALDSAALALQTRISIDSNSTLVSKAQTILTERLNDTSITATVSSITTDATVGKLNIQANIVVPTSFVQMIGIPTIRSNMVAEVTRGSSDVEVSVALDTTGSMGGSKITDLISATNTLIDLVVQTTQTPTYTKMAIVPWTNSVNVGSYATDVRGSIRGPWTVTGAAWFTGTVRTVSAVTKANPGVVTTTAAHGFSTGDYIRFSGISGMSQINNKIYQITVTTTTKFKLNITATTWVNTSSYSTFSYNSGSGKATKCLNSTCSVEITASGGHGLVAGEQVYFSGVGGMTQLNGNTYTVSAPTSTKFVLSGTLGSSFSAYTSGGSSSCIVYGCDKYSFTNASGGTNRNTVSTCVSERTTDAYTDAAPSTTPLGLVYPPSSGNTCISQTILPLTSDKTALHAMANSLTAAGSTAGQLGLAWGWYMIAPNFAYLWPTASQPAAYGEANLIKAVILMTDGDFNTPYCTGVIAADALSGSGNSSTHINCNSPNGSSKAQAQALCDAIKVESNHTLLYTVGFDLGSNSAALTFLEDCATAPSYFFQADTGADLEDAFQAIAETLSSLRISK